MEQPMRSPTKLSRESMKILLPIQQIQAEFRKIKQRIRSDKSLIQSLANSCQELTVTAQQSWFLWLRFREFREYREKRESYIQRIASAYDRITNVLVPRLEELLQTVKVLKVMVLVDLNFRENFPELSGPAIYFNEQIPAEAYDLYLRQAEEGMLNCIKEIDNIEWWEFGPRPKVSLGGRLSNLYLWAKPWAPILPGGILLTVFVCTLIVVGVQKMKIPG